MENCGFSPQCFASWRTMRTPRAWKVQTVSPFAACPPISPATRSCISLAALLGARRVHRLGTTADTELAHDVAHVELDRRGRNEQLFTDLRIRQAGGEQSQHLELTVGELL